MKNKFCCFFEKHREIIMYLFFGVATTLVNFLVYSVLFGTFGIEMTLSNGFAWVTAVLFSFMTNKTFVFESKSKKIGAVAFEFLSFVGARVVTGIIEIVTPTLLYSIGFDFELFGIAGFGAKASVSVVVIILNYVFSKLLVFKKGIENKKRL